MYSILQENHPKYSNIINIFLSESGEENPFYAFEKLKYLRRIFKEKNPKVKLRYLVLDKILTFDQVKFWAKEEYLSLPKCKNCAKILSNQVFQHKLSNDLFCTIKCSDENYAELSTKQEEEDEYEFYL